MQCFMNKCIFIRISLKHVSWKLNPILQINSLIIMRRKMMMTHLEYTDRQCSSLCPVHFCHTLSLHIWALGLHTLYFANVHTLNCIQTRETTRTSHHPLQTNTDIHKLPVLLTQRLLILVQFSKHLFASPCSNLHI